MVPLTELWLPILLSAVLVFFVSAIFHTLLPHHRTDFQPVPPDSGVRESLRLADLARGEYLIPHPAAREELGATEYQRMMEEGPVVQLRVLPAGPIAMGKPLALWFLKLLLVGVLAAYVASGALGYGAEYREVFRYTSAIAAAAYVLGVWQESIWFGRPWSNTLKSSADGLVYALLTAGVFGWLWP